MGCWLTCSNLLEAWLEAFKAYDGYYWCLGLWFVLFCCLVVYVSMRFVRWDLFVFVGYVLFACTRVGGVWGDYCGWGL